MMTDTVRKARRRVVSDEEVLQGAFEAFAVTEYDAMSVRQLNAALGLSHETVRQRLGSTRDLYRAAVDHGVARFNWLLAEERMALPAAPDELGELRYMTRVHHGVDAPTPVGEPGQS